MAHYCDMRQIGAGARGKARCLQPLDFVHGA